MHSAKWHRCDFRDELVDIQSSAYQLLYEDGSISEVGRGTAVVEYKAGEGVGGEECRVVRGVCVFEIG
ncbi:hypothetical protein A2U01_0072574, partial [Trifolium medium]|nr:hypothetical protein [Trifolium medium]